MLNANEVRKLVQVATMVIDKAKEQDHDKYFTGEGATITFSGAELQTFRANLETVRAMFYQEVAS